ncbi:hypothetical protein B2J88_49695 [Rhodococcus sp. SRB_17]|nr:hypothetical protein [Rhodococcus sp. SRB_17]
MEETPHSSALDVGCGTGDLLDGLAQRFDSVTGLEPDPVIEQIASARTVAGRLPVEMTAPVVVPVETLAEIKRAAKAHLSGSRSHPRQCAA